MIVKDHKEENKMKVNKTLTSIVLAGTMAMAGCDNVEESSQPKSRSGQTIFVTTAEKLTIEPHYGADSILMDGIVVKRFAYGNGGHIPNIEDSTVYTKGSPEYEALRPFLSVKASE